MNVTDPASAIAFPGHPAVSLWQCLEQAVGMGRAVVLTPDQCRDLLADHARLTEAKNEAVRQEHAA